MPELMVETKYGPLAVKVGAGPTSAPGHVTASDHVYPTTAHAFDREPEAPHLYAYAGDSGLTINGIPYTVLYARWSLREAQGYETKGLDWREEYGAGPALKRSDILFGGEPTDAARKAWHEIISPAVCAALRSADAAILDARIDALNKYAGSLRETAARLRAEADRLDGMSLAAFDEYAALVRDAVPMA